MLHCQLGQLRDLCVFWPLWFLSWSWYRGPFIGWGFVQHVSCISACWGRCTVIVLIDQVWLHLELLIITNIWPPSWILYFFPSREWNARATLPYKMKNNISKTLGLLCLIIHHDHLISDCSLRDWLMEFDVFLKKKFRYSFL